MGKYFTAGQNLNFNSKSFTKMKIAKVTFQNGEVITTPINGTETEIKNYYKVGRLFNLGNGATSEDNMQAVEKCEVISSNELTSRVVQLMANYSIDRVLQIMFEERNTSTTIDDIEFCLNNYNN